MTPRQIELMNEAYDQIGNYMITMTGDELTPAIISNVRAVYGVNTVTLFYVLNNNDVCPVHVAKTFTSREECLQAIERYKQKIQEVQ